MENIKKNFYLFGFGFLVLMAALFMIPNPVHAVNTYYFNNAVDTNPATLGNYWNDAEQTDPAAGLPNFNVDVVYVTEGAEFIGNIIFNGTAINNGTVTGDAVFVGDASENTGTVSGTATRKYTSNTTTTRTFTDISWNVIADGCVVDISGATYDGTTTLSAVNGGSFIQINITDAHFYNQEIYLTYTSALNPSFIPETTAFDVIINGALTTVTDVDISDTEVILSVSSNLAAGDEVVISYTPFSTYLKALSGDFIAPAFSNVEAILVISVGSNPYYVTYLNGKIYVANQSSGGPANDTVSVVDTSTDTISSTITIDAQPYDISTVGSKLYINSYGSNEVTVINSLTDSVSSSINVGNNPYYSTTAGNKVYISNSGSNNISVIDTSTDSVIATISVGSGPWDIATVGTKVYVANSADDTVSVIDTATNTVSTTISVGDNPHYFGVSGTKLYVGNYNAGTVSVIDMVTDSVTATITVGTSPGFFTVYGNYVYVLCSGGMYRINTSNNTATSLSNLTGFASVLDNKIFVSNSTYNNIKVVDPETFTVAETLDSGIQPFYSAVHDDKIYFVNISSNSVSVFDAKKITSQLPNLISFTTNRPDGIYSSGEEIKVNANFGRDIISGSTMTVVLTNGDTVVLSHAVGGMLSGSYFIGTEDETPDFGVRAISSANIIDSTGTYNRTSYDMPSSVGDFEGENSFITRNIGDSKNVQIGDHVTIDVGDNPYQISVPVSVGGVQYVYVANQGSHDVSVVRTDNRIVVDTIPVGSEPYGLTAASIGGVTYIYVANINSDDVSVINTETNAVVATIDVGVKPYYTTAVGTNVYVTNGASNTVSVINANTNTVTATISVGSYPRGIKAHGTNLYVSNYGDPNYSGGDYISIIDSGTNTVTGTVILPTGSSGPRGITVLGSKVYVANYRSNNVSVINTATNAITATIAVGQGPRGITGVGTNIYVENFDDGTISVIDTNSSTVTDTIDVGHSPSGMSVVGNYIYVSSFQDGLVRVLDTATNTMILETDLVEAAPSSSGTIGSGGSGSNTNTLQTNVSSVTPSPAPAAPTLYCKFTTLMKRGSKYGEVPVLQKILTVLGFDSGPADGLFGPLTDKATKEFQRAKNLAVDGIVGPITRAALNSSCK